MGSCAYSLRDGVHSQIVLHYYEKEHRLYEGAESAWFVVEWEGNTLEVITVGVKNYYGVDRHHFVLAPESAIADAFILACCEANAEVKDEVLVFNSTWEKDKDLFNDIKSSTLENLILAPGLKEQIVGDFETFFRSKELYAGYQIPWKRGVLLLGPPGNGKTHIIKALVNRLGLPCLYVRSMEDMDHTDQQMMAQVFQKARSTAPCILIFEDLDAQVTDENRSFFLNELDGFAANEGIMTIASTNHPERLDPAILERPSRFDRKYTFNLPELGERLRYLALQSDRLESNLQLTADQIDQIARATDEFSFAYLKELVLSSMMNWINLGGTKSMADIMVMQVDTLRSQMKTVEPEPEPDEEEDDSPGSRPRRRFRRGMFPY